jgi:hypothetical protein
MKLQKRFQNKDFKGNMTKIALLRIFGELIKMHVENGLSL